MSKPEPFWNIRLASTTRRLFYRIPRGEATNFNEVVQILRFGPNPAGVERVGENDYQYSANGYRIAFEIVGDTPNTIRVITFRREQL